MCITVLVGRRSHSCVVSTFNESNLYCVYIVLSSQIYSSVTMNGSFNVVQYVVRLRGLPWNTSQSEIFTFLQGKFD